LVTCCKKLKYMDIQNWHIDCLIELANF